MQCLIFLDEYRSNTKRLRVYPFLCLYPGLLFVVIFWFLAGLVSVVESSFMLTFDDVFIGCMARLQGRKSRC